jgi:hypothetical protein
MFEREIKFIYDFNLNKVNKLGPYFTFEQLQSIDLHPAILHYISAEIDYLVFEDRQKLLKNSVFDYSGEKITYHFNEITDELKKIKRFSLEYVAKLILHSTSFTINFLVRPKWTLARFIYDESKHKTSNEIKQILNYIYYYKFLKKIVTSYINSKKILSMNTQEFEELLDKADKLGIETNLKGILSHSFISMAEFFNIGQMQKTRIPLTAVELFLEEKDLPHHLQKLTDTFGNDENARFNIGDYMKVLTTVMITMKEDAPKQDQMILFDDDEEEPIVESIESEEESIDNEAIAFRDKLETPVEDFATEEEVVEDKTEIEDDELSKEEIAAKVEEDEEDLLKKWNETKFDESNELETADKIKEIPEETTEIITAPEEEIRVQPHTKIRIKVNEENNIELLNDDNLREREEATELTIPEGMSDEFDRFSSIMKIDSEDEEPDTVDDVVEINLQPPAGLNFETEEEENPAVNTEPVLTFGSFDEVESQEEIIQNLAEDDEEVVTFKSVLENINEEDDKIPAPDETEQSKLELAEIFEHKNVTKIIEVIFDYDIEDFANMLDEISSTRNVDDAHYIINETLSNRRINLNSKEAEALRDIITEYFDRK